MNTIKSISVEITAEYSTNSANLLLDLAFKEAEEKIRVLREETSIYKKAIDATHEEMVDIIEKDVQPLFQYADKLMSLKRVNSLRYYVAQAGSGTLVSFIFSKPNKESPVLFFVCWEGYRVHLDDSILKNSPVIAEWYKWKTTEQLIQRLLKDLGDTVDAVERRLVEQKELLNDYVRNNNNNNNN